MSSKYVSKRRDDPSLVSNYQRVADFNKSFGVEKGSASDRDDIESEWTEEVASQRALRLKLISEELDELFQAVLGTPENHIYDLIIEETMLNHASPYQPIDRVGVADALADLLYVVYGAAYTFDIDIDEVFREVHRSNMSKLDQDGNPIYREDGKILKSNRFSKPDIESVLRSQEEIKGYDKSSQDRF